MSELKKKIKELGRVERAYAKKIEDARRRGASNDELESLRSEAGFETDIVMDEINQIKTHQLMAKAWQWDIDTPSHNEKGMWEESYVSRRRYLTPAGISEVRSKIREEARARREAWIAWTTPLIGIIGAVTGLLAVLALLV